MKASGPVSPIPRTSPPGVAIEDPSLVAVLPADVDGQPVVLESQAFVDAIADPAFAANVEAAAFGVVVAGKARVPADGKALIIEASKIHVVQ